MLLGAAPDSSSSSSSSSSSIAAVFSHFDVALEGVAADGHSGPSPRPSEHTLLRRLRAVVDRHAIISIELIRPEVQVVVDTTSLVRRPPM